MNTARILLLGLKEEKNLCLIRIHSNMSNCRINIFEPGNVLSNKWVILELIGKGAMGEIYLAHQLNLKRDVAIKVVSEELLKDFFDFRKADQRADIYSLGKIL